MTETTGRSDKAMPPGPWLLVVGMHRSGTSAVTGALGGLGFALPAEEDRMEWSESNPEHWESLSLTVLDDDLLRTLGGTWDAPPTLEAGWENHADPVWAGDAVAAAGRAFSGHGAIAWKDPRLCLLLPLWARLLPPPLATVLVWRPPIAVARSLERRDGIPMADGLALWERYNLAALANLRGHDVFVLDYPELVSEPRRTAHDLATWIDSLPQFASLSASDRLADAVAVVSGELEHHRSPGAKEVPDGQRQVASLLIELGGPHRPLETVPIPPESEMTTTIIESRRKLTVEIVDLKAAKAELERQVHSLETELWERRGELLSARGELEARLAQLASRERDVEILQQTLANLRASTSWRVTSPLRRAATLLDDLKGRVR